MDRKLVADIAGYSRLMGVDEEGTLNTLRAHREVVDGRRRGRVFNSAGDSVIAEFASAVEATLCALRSSKRLTGAMRRCRWRSGWRSASASTSAMS